MTFIQIPSIKTAIIFSLLAICSCVTYSQTKPAKDTVVRGGNTNKDSSLAKYILTNEQALQIYSFKMQQGKQEREFLKNNPKSDAFALYRKDVENKKDAFYKSLLPKDKYQLYKEKKLMILVPVTK